MYTNILFLLFVLNRATVQVRARPVCKFGATLDKKGKCVCPILNCPRGNKTICGSNGITYFSDCELVKDICELQTFIYVFKEGVCGWKDQACSSLACLKNCPNGYNQTKQGCVRCRCRDKMACSTSRQLHHCLYGFTINSKGCPACAEDPCKSADCPGSRCKVVNGHAVCLCRKCDRRLYKPVCSVDGKRYQHECFLRHEECLERRVIGVGTCK